MERLSKLPHLVGVKQCRRAIKDGQAALVFLASDTEERVRLPLEALCAECSVQVVEVTSMSELGRACGINVGAAVAALMKE